jgi:signal transduction histidine kinase
VTAQPDLSRRILAVALAVSVAGVTATLMARGLQEGLRPGFVGAAADIVWVFLPLAVAGAAFLILIQQARNPIGWLLMVWAVGSAAAILNSDMIPAAPPDRLELWMWLRLWFHNWSWLLLVFPLFHLLQVFPTGRLLGKGWRWLVRLELAMAGFLVVIEALPERIGALADWGETVPTWTVDNPIGVLPVTMWDGPVGIGWIAGLMALSVGSAASMIIRYRRAAPDERHQLKWLLFAVVTFVLVYIGAPSYSGGASALESIGGPSLPALDPVAFDLGLALALVATPASIAIAVLRFRLYDIDTVISRTLVWGTLALLMALFYFFVVVTLGVVGIAIVAIAFQPVRRWLQQAANRVVYGRRATPYEVLSDLTQTLASVESIKGVLDRTARRLGDATTATSAAVWIADGEHLRPVGVWPSDTAFPSDVTWDDLPGHTTVIGPEDEPLGALTILKGIGDAVTPPERRLIDDLAGSSASVLRHAALQAQLSARAAELAASRRRLMEVQDTERHRMERELDEGAQQLVVSLKVKLNVAARLARADGALGLAELLEGMDQEARDAIAQIRSLARGLYPPLLEAEGLETAVRALAELSPIPVEVKANLRSDERFPLETEAAIFFCISEAMTNAAKHAGDRPITVRMSREADAVTFEVSDSGPGFEPGSVGIGSGLRNMADRLDAIGGTLSVESAPGRGTRVRGELPLPSPLLAVSGVLDPVGG